MTATTLPGVDDFALALQKLDALWNLVPRSARPMPVHKKLKDDLDRILQRCGYYVRSRETQLTAKNAVGGAGGAGVADIAAPNDDEPALAYVMRMMRTLDAEQWRQVQAMMMLRSLSDEGRFEVIQEIGATHHLECGGELFPDEPHDCEIDAAAEDDGVPDDDEDVDDDGDDAAAPAADAGAARNPE